MSALRRHLDLMKDPWKEIIEQQALRKTLLPMEEQSAESILK